MEHPIQSKTEMKPGGMLPGIHDPYEGVSAARLVDEKITDVVRLTVAACNIVLESDVDCPQECRVRMQARVFQMLGVKERRG